MPDRVNVANVTCPASTPLAAPVEVFLQQFPPGIPRKLTIVIPAGHAGLTGIAAGYGHQPVIPDNGAAFIQGDDDVVHLELSNYPAGPQWSVFMFNLDPEPHSWQVRFEFDEIIGQPVLTDIVPIPPDDIAAAGDAALSEAS